MKYPIKYPYVNMDRIVEPHDHEVWLNFVSDVDACMFRDWLGAGGGWEKFLEWAQENVDRYVY